MYLHLGNKPKTEGAHEIPLEDLKSKFDKLLEAIVVTELILWSGGR